MRSLQVLGRKEQHLSEGVDGGRGAREVMKEDHLHVGIRTTPLSFGKLCRVLVEGVIG